MKTFDVNKKEILKEVAALEKKELDIRLTHRYCRLHGDKACGHVTAYDREFVTFTDYNGDHFVPLAKFNKDFFRKGV